MMSMIEHRPKNLGVLMVVGGPGGSGISTIARALARHYKLGYVYSGSIMRTIAHDYGFSEVGAFLESDVFDKVKLKIDTLIDKKMVKMSMIPNVLLDSKLFAGLAFVQNIICTVTIWITASLDVRVIREISGDNELSKKLAEEGTRVDLTSIKKTDELYKNIRTRLMQRYSNDKKRFRSLYGINYDKPELYNDIVIDSSALNIPQTFNLVLKEIKNGGYIE